jgi:hypothetical protein
MSALGCIAMVQTPRHPDLSKLILTNFFMAFSIGTVFQAGLLRRKHD